MSTFKIVQIMRGSLHAQVLHATCAGSALGQSSSDSLNDLPAELSSSGGCTEQDLYDSWSCASPYCIAGISSIVISDIAHIVS